jgi:[ribosomal protein S18]-alanine N-acetyltransferase
MGEGMVAFVLENHMETIGAFAFRKMDEPSVREIIQWRYDASYDMYNCDPKDIEETVQAFQDPQYRYYSLWDQGGELVGYCCFGEDGRVPGGDYGAQALDIGGGLRPDLTGQGLGSSFMEAALEFARRHFAPVAFRATVAAFNRRALRVCEKMAFRQIQTFESTHSGKPFIILVREAE